MSADTHPVIPELLAPAGDWDCVRAAVANGADAVYFDEIWNGVNGQYDELLSALSPHLSRDAAALSPIERAILLIGAWELTSRTEIPYRVVINEAVELAKSFGATDGHRFVNGVLDKLAAGARAAEIAALSR